MKKKWLLLLLVLLPFNVYAYSDKVMISGFPVGIEVHSKGIYVVDFYKVNNQYIGKNAGFKKGDLIQKVNGVEVSSIKEFHELINKEGPYSFQVLRNQEEKIIEMKVKKENNVLKTGFYVKDQINGVGTLSYIDPETKIFASLGHEILESSSMSKFETMNGYIYDANINYINKSVDGNIGEVHASFDSLLKGTIEKNELNGIYGKYMDSMDDFLEVDVASLDEIQKGDAYIHLNIDGVEARDYQINILSFNSEDVVKNIYFEIVDDNLLKRTGGIVQGMSGSPILQNNKIIGVVNYVVVEDAKKGYGIFIQTMLEEGDKLLEE